MKSVKSDLTQALRLFTGFPCTLVTTDDNIITVAMAHIFSFSPPMLGIGISPRRYSYKLLKQTQEFVVNLPTAELLAQVGYCGEVSGREVDKFTETGLSRQKSLNFKIIYFLIRCLFCWF
jgi:flavin reductase (DIM6/NTAB) family NADH-FMN oxidoreductase RutF